MMADDARRRRSRWHSLVLLAAMAALLALGGWIIARWQGIAWSIFAAAVMLYIVRQMPVAMVLRAIGARRVLPQQAPVLFDVLAVLCRRAGLNTLPQLAWVGDRFPAAFTMGQGEDATIVLSHGLVREMSVREIRGILAHELVHLRNGDIALMQLAMVAGRLTRLLTQIAFILVLFDLFLHAMSAPSIPLVPLMILAVAPSGVGLLQLALSREREGEADLEAAELTGDPRGLARALVKIRQREQMLLRGRFPDAVVLRVPSMFRDHPATEDRIRRLLAMPQPPEFDEDAADDASPFPPPPGSGSRRGPGPWG